ncbi:MAG: TIGR00296 family protein [Candidatus Bathyarchaeia archaeon]
MVFELSHDEGVYLVRLARRAIETYLRSRKRIDPTDAPEKMRTPCGVFTTLNRVTASGKELRGCIGFPYPVKPLAEAVVASAISAAVEDPRFQPLSPGEAEEVVVEVSVLTPPEPMRVEGPRDYPEKIQIGVDGLIVERGSRSGLLLPQVPVEWGWDAEEFLTQCCLKAWLPPDAWLMEGTRISKFQAIIFEEREPKGEVERRELST